MQKQGIVLQDLFLNQVRKDRVGVTIHLMNGFQIRGMVKGFDSFIVVVESEGKQMVIYKHAISTITPSKSVLLTGMATENEENK